MMPAIFNALSLRKAAGQGADAIASAQREAAKEGAAVLGFTSAVAAIGAFFIPKSFGSSIALTGGVTAALVGFIFFYLTCLALTWWYYTRRNAEVRLTGTPVQASSTAAAIPH
jgi:NNP family nitrate/nitrite transporter-like MFS transporter